MPERFLVTIDGAVLDPDVPFLCADDLGVVRGDGLFETLLVREGTARKVDLHLARLTGGAQALELPAPDENAWRAAIETGLRVWEEANGNAEALLRLVITRGRESSPADAGRPTDKSGKKDVGLTRENNDVTAYLTLGPIPERTVTARETGVRVITANRGYSIDLAATAPWQLLGAKTLSYATNMAVLRHAHRQGADEVIYLSSEGEVLESPRACVIAVVGKSLFTPSPDSGILWSTTQQALFRYAQTQGWTTGYRSLRPADLLRADAVWLVSSVTVATRVTEINGFELTAPANPEEFATLVNHAIENES